MSVARVENVRDAEQVSQLYLRSVIASKQYGHEQWLAPLVAQACVAAAEPLDDMSKVGFCFFVLFFF